MGRSGTRRAHRWLLLSQVSGGNFGWDRGSSVADQFWVAVEEVDQSWGEEGDLLFCHVDSQQVEQAMEILVHQQDPVTLPWKVGSDPDHHLIGVDLRFAGCVRR